VTLEVDSSLQAEELELLAKLEEANR
jgi:hypothetical protein